MLRQGAPSLSHSGATASVASQPIRAWQASNPTIASAAGAEAGAACLVGLAVSGAAAALRRRGQRTLKVRAAAPGGVVDVEGSTVGGPAREDGMDYMTVVPEGGVAEEDKRAVPRVVYEGVDEVDLNDAKKRPSGRSQDPDNIYFWKMSRDKRTIDVVFPIDDGVRQEDIVYRLGEDPQDIKRGPTLEAGYRYRNQAGRTKEKLILDGQILNAINRQDSYWTIEDMAGVSCCVITLTRPSMMRQRHDPILHRSVEEERIEPQTWDALLVEERIKPEVTDRVYFDLSLSGEPGGRLEIGLFGGILPKTVKNFVGLVTGEYVDDDGNKAESAHCFKGTTLQQILGDFLIAAGNPGLDHVLISFDQEELKEYLAFYEDFRTTPKQVGKVQKNWAIRWGADLGLPVIDEEGVRKKEGGPVDGNSEEELNLVLERMRELDAKGEGANFIFFRPEWEKGCDVTGKTFPAEGFKVPHSKRGTISMDRNEDKDMQGSTFFITLKEFPEMDKRWVAFGEVLEGWDLITKLEEDYAGAEQEVVIEDCGIIAPEEAEAA